MKSVEGGSVGCRGAVPDLTAKFECRSYVCFVEKGEDVSVGSPGVAGESLKECEFLFGSVGEFENVVRPFESFVECESQKNGVWIVFEGGVV